MLPLGVFAHLHSVNDVLGGGHGHAPGAHTQLDVLEHQPENIWILLKIFNVLNIVVPGDALLHVGERGHEQVPGGLGPPVAEVVGEVAGQRGQRGQVSLLQPGGRGRGGLVAVRVHEADAEEQLWTNTTVE